MITLRRHTPYDACHYFAAPYALYADYAAVAYAAALILRFFLRCFRR